jgi:hypothetical protein
MKKNSFLYLKTLCLLSFLSFFSCNSKQNYIKNEAIEKTKPSQILFLNYSISKKGEDAYEIKLIKKIITEGKLKNKGIINQPQNDFECNQIDIHSHILETSKFSNPLIQRVESVDNNGNLVSKIIERNEAEFSVRMQFHPLAKFATINESTKTNILTKDQL